MEKENSLTPLAGGEIRKVWHDEEWYFSIVDIIQILTDSPNPSRYWTNLKTREKELYPNWVKLKLVGQDGKARPSDCANRQGVLRIIMSVPSQKAENIKQWLAQVGSERIEEIENPEIGINRNLAYYKAKGYSDEWIKNRLETIKTRNRLTEEWKNRGVKEGKEYAYLTATIAKGTFGLTPSEHKKLKGLEKPSQELRDNMTPIELIFTALGEEATRILAVQENAQGFEENRDKAIKGGQGAGVARNNFEKATGIKVLSSKNYLEQSENTNTNELPEG